MSADDWSGLMDMTAARRRNTTLLSTTLWFNAAAFYPHFGVAGHGEGVEAASDYSQPGSDQQRCSVGLCPQRFESPVETGGRVRLRTTRRDNDQNPGTGDDQSFGDVPTVPSRRTRSLESPLRSSRKLRLAPL